MDEKRLSTKEIKQIAHDICSEEKAKYALDIDVFPITIIEYYKDSFFGKKYKLIRNLEDMILPFITSGFHSPKNNNVVIFVHSIKQILRIEHQYFSLVENCYHEMHHEFQKTFDKYSYEGFLHDIDWFIRNYDDRDYAANTKGYSFEIGAYLYGITKAKEYMKNKCPRLYEKDKEHIEKLEKKHYFNYMMYDASDRVEKMIQLVKTLLKDHQDDTVENMGTISPVLEIFLNPNMSFKKINEMIGHEKFKELDKRIVYAFLSSKSFLKSVNLDELSDEELNILSQSLQYTSSVYQNQLKLLPKQKNISLKEIFKSEKTIIGKLDLVNYIEKIIVQLIANKKNIKREQHIENRRQNLNEINRLIKKRTNRGYIVVNSFYIIGTIISTLTILYLLIKK